MAKVCTYLVDNCQSILEILEGSLTDLGYEIIGTAGTKAGAENDFSKLTPDVVITDVNLSGNYEGIELAKKIRDSTWRNADIIFLSNETSAYTFKMAEEVEPAAYLIKPLNIYNITYAIELALKKKEENFIEINKNNLLRAEITDDILHIKKMHKIVRVPISTIYYIAVEANYSTVATKLGKFTIRQSLKDLIEKLPQNIFLRIHRNYMVNINQIVEYDFGEFTARLPDKSLPIGRRYKRYITKRLTLLS
ncbi:MAG: LytTR family DNA-binding domain-containing protein [Ignavibacteria bacterium]|jgi:DNA-binding LytR/AlgR family response regulator